MMRGELPASCSGHCLFYGHRTPLFSELPIRHVDFEVIQRNNGAFNPLPLPHVCRLIEDDSHIFCRPDQIAQEVKDTINFIKFFYGTVLKFSVEIELSKRPHHCCAEYKSTVEAVEDMLTDLFASLEGSHRINENAAPYYGPRININIQEPTGRFHLFAAIQLDFELPQRFDLAYINEDGQRARPMLIHRAIIPPAQTILAIIATECNEFWPFWLSIRQMVVIPVCATSVPYARKIAKELLDANFEVEANFECLGTLNRRIKTAIVSRHNFILVVGKTECANGTVNVRTRNDLVLGEFALYEVLRLFRSFLENYSSDRQCAEAFMELCGPEVR